MSRRKNKPQQPHSEPVKVEVGGAQVSAASRIAMAGDAIETMAADALEQKGEPMQTAEPPAEPRQRRDDVKPHLRCPCCWNGYGGKAARRKWQRQVSGPLVQRCYVCDQCGTEWTVDVRVEEVDGIEWVETKISKVKPREGAA